MYKEFQKDNVHLCYYYGHMYLIMCYVIIYLWTIMN